MAAQPAGLRQQVDPHWRRGISYLKIGLRWLNGVLHKGRTLLSRLSITLKLHSLFLFPSEPKNSSMTNFGSHGSARHKVDSSIFL